MNKLESQYLNRVSFRDVTSNNNNASLSLRVNVKLTNTYFFSAKIMVGKLVSL